MKFSVVITTKNRLEYLKRAVNSVFDNSLLPSDIVIVNDGGNRIELNDVCSLGSSLSDFVSVKIVNNPESVGGNKARNQAISLCSENIVFLLDDDDSFCSDSFESRLKLFDTLDVGVVFTGINIVKASNTEHVVRKVQPKDSDDYYSDLLSKGNIIGSTSRVAIRKEHFELAGKFDENLSSFQDFDLWIRMSQISKIKHDAHIGVNYTIHDNKVSSQISTDYNKYLSAGAYLKEKYQNEISDLDCAGKFDSTIFFRVSQSVSSVSYRKKMIYGLMSFQRSPSLKKFIFSILPYSIVVKLFPFV